MLELGGCAFESALKGVFVGLVVGSDARERKAKNAPDRVNIAPCVGLGKAVLFGRGKAPGAE